MRSRFTEALDRWRHSPPSAIELDHQVCWRDLFESQLKSRHLDYAARRLKTAGKSYYTIGSAGHEGNVVLGALARHTDPAFLHYRSGALMMERARQDGALDPCRDTLLSLMAARDEPIAGGRHKVWGSRPLWVPPQTSTIASHFPKAVGTAFALERSRRLGIDAPVPEDAITICSFGDASLNHSTAVGAINMAQWVAYQKLPLPVLFVCEDNGLGVSVKTPKGWVESRWGDMLPFYSADGTSLASAHAVAQKAINRCRSERYPVFLRLETVRLMGHAGSDVEAVYRSAAELEADEARDPLVQSAAQLIGGGQLSLDEVIALDQQVAARIQSLAEELVGAAPLQSRADVMAPLVWPSPDVIDKAVKTADRPNRVAHFGGADKLPELQKPTQMAPLINWALQDALLQYPQAILFGEDVARKGGVYNLTPGLLSKFGSARVFDTLLDEQSILGMAQGAAFMGMLPIPEIQYLAYVYNALDQLRGEACSTAFFSQKQFLNPMVIRVAGLAYQKGFGGHFHNDNGFASLREIPGLVIACPSRGDDAVGMLRTSLALAKEGGRVVVFLEPIALYNEKDLFEPKDGEWCFEYPTPGNAVLFGEMRVYQPDECELLMVTYGNGVRFCLQAASQLKNENSIKASVCDLRWLNPLNKDALAELAGRYSHILVVDEGRQTGGISEAIITAIIEGCESTPKIRRVVGADSYIPLGPAAGLVLPSAPEVVTVARKMLGIG